MKRIQLIVFTIGISSFAMGQKSDSTKIEEKKTWKISSALGLTFTQVSLTNWAAGGKNVLAWASTADFRADYKEEKWKSDNIIHLGYGQSKQGEDALNKTDDQILLNTNIGHEFKKSWYVIFNVNFRTQFARGYGSSNNSKIVSKFMAPGYLIAGFGVEYKPNDNFGVMFKPVTNKTLFVLDDLLSAQGAYGVDTLARYKTNFGTFLSISYKKEIIKNVSLTTLYNMFSSYKNLAVWAVNWDVIIDFKINSFLAANITTNLIYDQNIKIPIDRTGDGIKESFTSKVQFREAFGIGIKAKF